MTAWLEMLKQIEPEYDQLLRIMEQPIPIRASLTKSRLGWVVKIEEDWSNGDVGHRYYTEPQDALDFRIQWTDLQLSNWKFVTRTAYNQWKFFNKKQAEKFITLFNLKWAE